MEIRIIGSAIFGLYLLLIGFPAVGSMIGINIPSVVSYIPAMGNFIIILLAAIWLAFDGMGEDHIIKKISLGVAGVLTVLFAIKIVLLAGWLSFALPGFLIAIEMWLYLIGGVLLVVGIFAYHM